MLKKLTLGILLLLPLAADATLYKVVKPDGTVVYTDKKQPGAVPVQLGNSNSATIPALAKPAKPRIKKTPKHIDYQLRIEQPVDGHTLWNNNGNFTVTASLSPLAAGNFQLFINQQLVQTQPVPRFTLSNVDRGEQQLQVKFTSRAGKVLAESAMHTLYLHKASVLRKVN